LMAVGEGRALMESIMVSDVAKGGYPLHGGDLRWASYRYGFDQGSFLDLSCSLNPLGPPPSALRAARKALRRVARYPEPAAESLREELARFLGVGAGSLVVGNGSTELIHLFLRWVGPRSVLLVEPCFSEYRRAAMAAGARVETYLLRAEDGFRLDPDRLAQEARGHELVVLVNPSSITGRFYPDRELEPVAQAAAEAGTLFLLDRSFMGLCDQAVGLAGWEVGGGESLFHLSTSTKLFALAGLRGPGWLVGPGEVVRKLELQSPPWRVGEPAAAALRAALSDRKYLARTRRLVPRWREKLASSLEGLPLKIFPSSVNLLLLRLPGGDVGEQLVHYLGRRGILVRWCADFPGLGPEFVRVAVGRPRQNRSLVQELRNFFDLRGKGGFAGDL